MRRYSLISGNTANMLAAPISKAVKFSLSDAVTKEIKLAICLSISYKRNGRGTEDLLSNRQR